ncbi:MAG: hypothetical protein QOK27_174 [Gemmatimonadales bacterium]|jgi:uncharacterized protein (TIGR02246 family)|nr:hypothetical protein [Gemmatimonadales bacterium]
MQNRLRIVAGLFALSAVVLGCERKDTDEKSEESGKAMANSAPADTKAAETEIRKGDEDFFGAVKSKDANAIAALYSNDAVSMPANSPPLGGHDAILKYNQDFLKVPHLAMTGESETIRFSDDGTMAYDAGKYSVSYVDAKGHTVKDEGKFLNVLKKVDGKWKIMVDAFSSNLAPPK